MTSPYIIENTKSLKASQDRSFIYVLLLNVSDDSMQKPFAVGSCKKILQKFSRNAISNWHYESFKRPIIVRILGTVHDKAVDEALAGLKFVLVKGGCYIPSTRITAKQGIRYVNKKEEIKYDLDGWARKFSILSPSLIGVSSVNKKVDHVFTVEHIESYINSQTQLSTEALNLALKIARTYSFDDDKASILFNDVRTKTEIDKLKKLLNQIRFIWNPQHKFIPYMVNEYRLTKPAIKFLTEKHG